MLAETWKWLGKHGSSAGALVSCAIALPSAIVAADQLNGAKEERQKTEQAARRADALLAEIKRLAEVQNSNLKIAEMQAVQMTRNADGTLQIARNQVEQANIARTGNDITQKDLLERISQFSRTQERQDAADQPVIRVVDHKIETFSTGEPPTIKLILRNSGRIAPIELKTDSKAYVVNPTQSVSAGDSCEIISKTINKTHDMGSDTTIDYWRNSPLTAEEYMSVMNGTKVFIWTGRLCYKDSNSRLRSTTFCFAHFGRRHAKCDIGNTVS